MSSSAITLATATARIASGSATSVDCAGKAAVDVYLEVTAVSGTATPTLTVILETSSDSATWTELGRFTAVTAAGRERIVVASALRYVRARWTITGTDPSFTFSVVGLAVQVFAAVTDLHQVGVRDVADADQTEVSGALVKRSVYAEGYLAASGKYTLPITAWGDDLTLCVAQLAAWDIMTVAVGFDPESAANTNWIERRNEAQRWLEWVAAGKVSPVGIVDSSPDVTESGFDIDSDTPRGW